MLLSLIRRNSPSFSLLSPAVKTHDTGADFSGTQDPEMHHPVQVFAELKGIEHIHVLEFCSYSYQKRFFSGY